jgi:creatinine amidohydrolase
MTWAELDEALEKRPVVLVPLGSVEQHGPHTPVGDYLASEVIARRVAEKTGSLFIPTVPYGYSETHRGFPGTLTISETTLKATLEDLTECLLEEGVDHILFLCGHGGNVPTIEHFARDLIHQGIVRVACIDIWRLITPDFNRELYGTPSPATGHGSEPIGSVMAKVTQGKNRPDLFQKPGKATFMGLPAKGSQVDLNGTLFHIYPSSVDTSEVGVIGDPSLCSPERGEKILEFVVKQCCDVVEWFKGIDTSVPEITPKRPSL